MILPARLSGFFRQLFMTDAGRRMDRRNFIETPVVTAPANNALNISVLAPLSLVASAYDGTRPQTGTEWVVANESTGIQAYVGIGPVPALTLSILTAYTIRVRYLSGSISSEWSEPIRIVTLA